MRVSSIGPAASRTLHDHGVRVDAEAALYTSGGLVEAILAAVEIGDGA